MSLEGRISRANQISPPQDLPHIENWPGAIVYRDGSAVLICEPVREISGTARRDKSELTTFRNLLPANFHDRLVETRFLGTIDGFRVFEQPWLEEWEGGDEDRIDRLLSDPDYILFLEAVREAVAKHAATKPWLEITVDIPKPENPMCGHADIRLRHDGSWCINDPIGVWVVGPEEPLRIDCAEPDRSLWIKRGRRGPDMTIQVGAAFFGSVPVDMEQLETVMAGELAAVTFADEEHRFTFSWRLVDLVVEYEGPKLAIVERISDPKGSGAFAPVYRPHRS